MNYFSANAKNMTCVFQVPPEFCRITIESEVWNL
jgi:hypothetical protein